MIFKDKVVLVTGASSGMGAAVAVLFSTQGARVVLVGLGQSQLDEVAARCDRPLAFCVDITNEDEIRHIIEQMVKRFGRIDILVNCAGMAITSESILTGNILKAYDRIMDVNLRAVVHLTTLVAPHLVKSKGNIVNISSAAGRRAPFDPGWGIYHVSKAALSHFTLCAAAELGPYGVRVNAVSAGPVRTEFMQNANYAVNWDDYAKFTVLDRLSEPDEIADLVLFLASDKAKGIIGSNYVIDNGALVKVAFVSTNKEKYKPIVSLQTSSRPSQDLYFLGTRIKFIQLYTTCENI